MQCIGEDRKRSWNEPAPFRSDEQHDDVQQSRQQPAGVGEKVPVAAEAQVLVSWERDP